MSTVHPEVVALDANGALKTILVIRAGSLAPHVIVKNVTVMAIRMFWPWEIVTVLPVNVFNVSITPRVTHANGAALVIMVIRSSPDMNSPMARDVQHVNAAKRDQSMMFVTSQQDSVNVTQVSQGSIVTNVWLNIMVSSQA